MQSITDAECRTVYNSPPPHENVLCAYNADVSTCLGDSGGYVGREVNDRFQQDCVVSFVNGDGCDTAPNGCTEVFPYLDWIESFVGVDNLHFWG